MANGKTIKALKKVVEGEHLAANALAVAAGKVKDGDLQQFLNGLQARHEQNAEQAGSRIKDLGGKYPLPGLKDTLKKGWEGVATSKTSKEAVKLLQKKEREALSSYKGVMKKIKDERTASMLLRGMADRTENIAELGDKLNSLQSKKKGGRILGLPIVIWLLGIGAGAVAVVRTRGSKAPENPTSPSGNGSKA